MPTYEVKCASCGRLITTHDKRKAYCAVCKELKRRMGVKFPPRDK